MTFTNGDVSSYLFTKDFSQEHWEKEKNEKKIHDSPVEKKDPWFSPFYH